MRLTLLMFSTLVFLVSPAFAHHTPEHTAGFHTITVKVNGLVCDFCARALEKVFYQQKEVQGVDVNLDDHNVRLEISDGTDIPDDKITSLITDAGYNVVEIIRE